ncbi:MAG: TlpA family protein disulfide reductase [Candidatus Eremiobacteraeota bacterium]|nr:TlpA family protein disulfide reductase [Candidatus Eremiobacteraeota bacterium]
MARRLPQLAIALLVLVAIVATIRMYFLPGAGPARGGGGPAALAGAPAQSYTLARLDGKSDGLAAYRGRVVLVNLWASWCAPCRSETPALEQLYEENRHRNFVVLGIDQGESAATARGFAKDMRLSYPILIDSDQEYGRAYAAIGLPTSLVVDRAGRIVRGFDGEMSLAAMRDAVLPLLSRP